MVETGILNRDIAAELAKLGHTDRVLIADAGLAIPNTTKVIDVSLDVNFPTTVDVLKDKLSGNLLSLTKASSSSILLVITSNKS